MREEKRKRNLLYPLFNPPKDNILKKMHYSITTRTFTVKTADISDAIVAIPLIFLSLSTLPL